MKKSRYEKAGAKEYRKAKEDWIDTQCKEIGACLNKNNSKTGYHLVKDMTSEKQGRSTTRKSLGKILQKNNRFSADGQSIAQSYTSMRVMMTIQFWTAVSTQKKIYSQSFMRKLRPQ